MAWAVFDAHAGTGRRATVMASPSAHRHRHRDLSTTMTFTHVLNRGDRGVRLAMESYPEAKRRYLAGLPARHTFFVTTLIRDRQDHFESVFVVVDQILGDRVTGRIANQVNLVRGYRNGDPLTFPEIEVIDWTISRPDGSEEGNLVGKFLDSLAARN